MRTQCTQLFFDVILFFGIHYFSQGLLEHFFPDVRRDKLKEYIKYGVLVEMHTKMCCMMFFLAVGPHVIYIPGSNSKRSCPTSVNLLQLYVDPLIRLSSHYWCFRAPKPYKMKCRDSSKPWNLVCPSS
jgi:hypothetical protein